MLLPASEAGVFGRKLRCEPQPQKNTLGYWTEKSDTAEWHLELPAGKYEVEVHQGCGNGSGGAEVELVFEGINETGGAGPRLKFTVADTGHFRSSNPASSAPSK